jgi:iron complex outermembrane receptor protein
MIDMRTAALSGIRHRALAGMLLAGAAIQPVAAQDIAAADPSGQAAAAGEIIVTAQRRSESIQRVPVSVTAVGEEALQNRQINDLVQITRTAPSLQVGIDNTFAVRGVGTSSFAGTVDSSVALAVDDVNFGRPLLNVIQFYDLARVEVLNGPQGLLFGKNASAGLLNITTRRPEIGELSADTDIEVHNRATPGHNADAFGTILRQTVNVPVTQNSALRVAGLYSYQEPATRFVGVEPDRFDPDLEQYAIRAKYLLEAEALTLYAIGEYAESHGIAGLFDRTYTELDPLSVNRAALALDNIVPGERNFLYAGEGDAYRDFKTGGVQATLAYAFPSGIEISNIAAWRFYRQDQTYDSDATRLDGASRIATDAEYDQYSNELRVALPAGNRLSGQAGLYYFYSTLDLANQIGGLNYVPPAVAARYPFCVGAVAVPNAPAGTCGVSNAYFLGRDQSYVLDTESYAAFGQLTYKVIDDLQVIAGGRVTRDEISIDLTQSQTNYFTNLGGPRGSVSEEYGNTNFSWRVGAQYQATPTIMAYGFYGRGYKGPGFNDVAATLTASLAVRPETSKAAEIGLKTSWLNRMLTVNLSAFQTDFDDFQVQAFDTELRTFIVQNAASVRSRGLEATVVLAPMTGLSIDFNAALLDSKFRQFAGAQCYPTQITMGCSATVNTFDASGMRLPLAPKFTSTLGVQYELPTSGPAVPFIGGNWYHRSTTAYQLNRAPGTVQDPIDVFGANIGVQFDNGLRLALFCKNCTNEIVPTNIVTESGDASARNNAGQATPRLSYYRQIGLDSVRVVGMTLGLRF